MMLLPSGTDATPMMRLRIRFPEGQKEPLEGASLYRDEQGNTYADRYQNCSPEAFFSALAGILNRWHDMFENSISVEIPDT
jgi:hypothetical protein